MIPKKISLLHATYRRAGGPQEVKDAWLSSARHPDLIEYIFAMDADDDASVKRTEGDIRVLSPPLSGWVTAVQNWNAAAALARGDLLMVIADDLVPPAGWDNTLLGFLGNLDPRQTPFAIKVTDSPHDNDTLLRHPVISRAFYDRYGLFSPRFHGMYCDNDITTRAFWRASILDGRELVLDHRNPHFDTDLRASDSQGRISANQEYEYGRAAYRAAWPEWRRSARVRLLPTHDGVPIGPSTLRWFRLRNGSLEMVSYVRRKGFRLGRLLMRSADLRERVGGTSPDKVTSERRRDPDST